MRDSEFTRDAAKEGSSIILSYLQGKVPGSEKVKVAMQAVNAHVKMKGTEANDDTNRLGLAKLIYADPKARESYFKQTMPHMLPKGK